MMVVMRGRIMLVIMIVVVAIVGALSEFRFHGGMADAVLAG